MTGQRPVLVVIDDEPGILDVVERFATCMGFDVVTCSGGREGIDRLEAAHPDLVMGDLRMPDVGGSRCCARFANRVPTVRPC
jgi:DNA-binding response OmpR family regulator